MVSWKKGNTLLINQNQAKEKWTIWAILSIFKIFPIHQNWGSFVDSHMSHHNVHKIYLQEKIVRSNIHKVVSISTNIFSHILHVFHQSIIKHVCISVEKGKVKHINMILKLGFRICDIPIFRKQSVENKKWEEEKKKSETDMDLMISNKTSWLQTMEEKRKREKKIRNREIKKVFHHAFMHSCIHVFMHINIWHINIASSRKRKEQIFHAFVIHMLA